MRRRAARARRGLAWPTVLLRRPILKFDCILETYVGGARLGFGSFLKAGPPRIKEKRHQDRPPRESPGRYDGDLLYAEDHESHAARASYLSPFDEAAILTVDGVGEWALRYTARRRGDPTTIRVINAGTVGYLLHQNLAAFNNVIPAHEPDQVIVLDGHNDLGALQLGVAPFAHRSD